MNLFALNGILFLCFCYFGVFYVLKKGESLLKLEMNLSSLG